MTVHLVDWGLLDGLLARLSHLHNVEFTYDVVRFSGVFYRLSQQLSALLPSAHLRFKYDERGIYADADAVLAVAARALGKLRMLDVLRGLRWVALPAAQTHLTLEAQIREQEMSLGDLLAWSHQKKLLLFQASDDSTEVRSITKCKFVQLASKLGQRNNDRFWNALRSDECAILILLEDVLQSSSELVNLRGDPAISCLKFIDSVGGVCRIWINTHAA